MDFYTLAEHLEQGIRTWLLLSDSRPPLTEEDVTELALALSEALLQQTDLPIEPPSSEFPAIEP